MARANVRRWLGALLSMSLTAATAWPALGAPGDEDAVQRLVDEGQRRHDAGDLQGALELFSRAFRASGSPEALRLVCQVELRLQMSIEAHRDLGKLLAFSSLEEKVRLAASRAMKQLEASLVALTIEGVPPGGSVQVDGAAMDNQIWLYPGPHMVTVDARGYKPFSWKGQLGAGEGGSPGAAPAGAAAAATAASPRREMGCRGHGRRRVELGGGGGGVRRGQSAHGPIDAALPWEVQASRIRPLLRSEARRAGERRGAGLRRHRHRRRLGARRVDVAALARLRLAPRRAPFRAPERRGQPGCGSLYS